MHKTFKTLVEGSSNNLSAISYRLHCVQSDPLNALKALKACANNWLLSGLDAKFGWKGFQWEVSEHFHDTLLLTCGFMAVKVRWGEWQSE